MKFVVLIITLSLIVLFFKIISARATRPNVKKNNETTIDLEKDPKTQEYKPKE